MAGLFLLLNSTQTNCKGTVAEWKFKHVSWARGEKTKTRQTDKFSFLNMPQVVCKTRSIVTSMKSSEDISLSDTEDVHRERIQYNTKYLP